MLTTRASLSLTRRGFRPKSFWGHGMPVVWLTPQEAWDKYGHENEENTFVVSRVAKRLFDPALRRSNPPSGDSTPPTAPSSMRSTAETEPVPSSE